MGSVWYAAMPLGESVPFRREGSKPVEQDLGSSEGYTGPLPEMTKAVSSRWSRGRRWWSCLQVVQGALGMQFVWVIAQAGVDLSGISPPCSCRFIPYHASVSNPNKYTGSPSWTWVELFPWIFFSLVLCLRWTYICSHHCRNSHSTYDFEILSFSLIRSHIHIHVHTHTHFYYKKPIGTELGTLLFVIYKIWWKFIQLEVKVMKSKD